MVPEASGGPVPEPVTTSRPVDKVGCVTDLATRLGFGPDDRLLIINADDLGLCHAANVGVFDALESGAASSATLMVPCPWARQAATLYQGEDIGVHLTLQKEIDASNNAVNQNRQAQPSRQSTHFAPCNRQA